MPNKNGTGPQSQGPRSGRGLGRSVGYASDQDNSWLEGQVKSLQAALQSITERLDAMKKD